MSFILRPAVAADRLAIRPLQEEIATLHHEGRPDLFKTEARFYDEASFQAMLDNPDEFIFIAENEAGRVVGYAFALLRRIRAHSTYHDFNQLYIDDICVLAEYRRQGIGAALFERCRQEAVALECNQIDLGVFAFNKEAIAFYESRGMKERMRRMELRL